MNFQKCILIVFNIIIINACEPPVVFSEAQPENKKELTTIPRKYQGTYLCETDSVTLIINNRTIYKKMRFETTLSKAEVDSNPDISIKNGKFYSKEFKQSVTAQFTNDSIVWQLILRDTLFNISEKQVIKSFKGQLIISKQLKNKSWEVQMLSLKRKKNLTMTKAEVPEDLHALEGITHIDETTYNESNKIQQIKISPTKREFRKILKQRLLFGESGIKFKRVSSDSEL